MRGRNEGALVETLRDERTGKSAQIRLKKGGMIFTCRIDEDHISDSDGRKVRQWARERIAMSDAIEWLPVLKIDSDCDRSFRYRGRRDEDESMDASVSLTVERFYIGRSPGGKWFETKWSTRNPDSPDYLDDAEVVAKADRFSEGNSAEDPDSYKNRHRASSAPIPKFRLPHVAGNTVYMPYNESAYQGALAILANLESTQDALKRILASKTAIANLTAIASGEAPAALLNAGPKKRGGK
jgi:hypothetical protein